MTADDIEDYDSLLKFLYENGLVDVAMSIKKMVREDDW